VVINSFDSTATNFIGLHLIPYTWPSDSDNTTTLYNTSFVNCLAHELHSGTLIGSAAASPFTGSTDASPS
jgi:hypothetical protein